MGEELLKFLHNYYVCLDKIHLKWTKITQETGKSLDALKNQCEQNRHVCSEEVDHAEICLIEGMRENLISKINLCIEEEIQQIQDAMKNLESLNNELKNKLYHLECARAKVCVDDPKIIEIIRGTPIRQNLNLLLQWALESQECYQQLYNDINGAFKGISRRDEETVTLLIKAFAGNKKYTSQIEKILAFTQFFINGGL